MITTEQLLQRAETLSMETDELLRRECLKIAYYSVLHRIQEVCEAVDIPLEKRQNLGIHEHLIDRINQNYSGKMIAEQARIMKRKRTIADYHLSESITDSDITKQLKLAKDCWYRLNKMLEEKTDANKVVEGKD